MALTIKPGCTTEIAAPATGLRVAPGCTVPEPTVFTDLFWPFAGDSRVDVVEGIVLETHNPDLFNFLDDRIEYVNGFIDRALHFQPIISGFTNQGLATGFQDGLARTSGDLLMSCWLKADVLAPNYFDALQYNGYDADGNEVFGAYCLLRANGFLGCYCFNETQFENSEIPLMASAGGPINPGDWLFLVLRYDSATGVLHVLANDVELGTVAAVTNVASAKGMFRFWTGAGGGGSIGDFTIDEIAVRINQTLGAADATSMYNSGVGNPYPF